MTHRNFCTLFDHRYLAKGLALYESLVKHCSEPFTLHTLAMSEEALIILNEMALPNMHVMALSAFETAMNLSPLRKNRTAVEFLYTCGSNLMEYLLPWMDSDGITYLDADVFFFSDPKVIFDEIGARSLGITSHRFSPSEQLRLGKNGEFNVGIVFVRNDETGRLCIARWARQCRERCLMSDGCGDQKYLDEWPELYGGSCCSIENIGVNLGPWSLDHLEISQSAGITFVDEKGSRPSFTFLNSFHFHEFVDHKFLSGYALGEGVLKFVYGPYLIAIADANERIRVSQETLLRRKSEAERQWETA